MVKSIVPTDAILDYVTRHSLPPDPVVESLIRETAALEDAGMQIAPFQGPLLHLLVRLTGARRILEIGTFTGMSSLWMARALPPGGRILCCDVSEEWTAIARSHWRRAEVGDRIDLRIGPALDTIRSLPPDETFDLAFVDADKPNYPAYLEEVVPRLRPGGLLVGDNTLWYGRVVDPDDDAESTESIRRFNRMAADHPDLETVLLPIADGVTLAWKRG